MSTVRALALLLAPLPMLACGTSDTGSALFALAAGAHGSGAAVNGASFTTSTGYEVRLDRAELLVGALYLQGTKPLPGAQRKPCTQPGLYVAEVTHGTLVDALSPDLQPFPELGSAIDEVARSAEVWLKGDDETISAESVAPFLYASGVAARGTEAWAFEAELSLNPQWRLPDPDPTRPGANPLCGERIVGGLEVAFRPQPSGHLDLEILPERWFRDVNFEELGEPGTRDTPSWVRFPDDPSSTAAYALSAGARSTGAFAVTWATR